MLARARSIMQLVFIELLAAFLLSSSIGSLFAHNGILGCVPDPGIPFALQQVVFLLLGLVALWWSLRGILMPRVLPIGIFSSFVIGIGGVRVTVPTRQVGIDAFPSTHPSYAIAEANFFAFLLIPAIAIGRDTAYVGCSQQWNYAFAWLLAAFALGFPLLRLFGWYVLRRRLPPQVAEGTHKGIYVPVGIALPVALVLFGMVYLPPLLAPTLDSESFAGGLAAHPDYAGESVHVAGTVIDGPITCACVATPSTACQSAVALLDLGDGGLVVLRGVSDYADEVQPLSVGKPARLYGELANKPFPDYTTSAGVCPTDPFAAAPGRPRAWLDVNGL